MKQEEVNKDARELLGLDVRFVSGVGTPATGKNFILYKSAEDKKGETDMPIDETKEVEPTVVASGDKWKENLSAAFKALADVAKALVSDDTGLKVSAPKNVQVPAGDGIVVDDTSKTPLPQANGSDGSNVTQQPLVTVGSPATTDMASVSLGAPVTKSLNDELARLEGKATNPEALAAAKELLSQAFAEKQDEGEDDMKYEEAQELVLKAVNPIIDAVEEIQTKLEEMDATNKVEKSAQLTKEAFDALKSDLSALNDKVSAIEAVVSGANSVNGLRKSKVPVTVEATQKNAGIWENSPFDIS